MARKVLTVLMLMGFVGSLSAISGCNTVAGAGKDIERGARRFRAKPRKCSRRCNARLAVPRMPNYIVAIELMPRCQGGPAGIGS